MNYLFRRHRRRGKFVLNKKRKENFELQPPKSPAVTTLPLPDFDPYVQGELVYGQNQLRALSKSHSKSDQVSFQSLSLDQNVPISLDRSMQSHSKS